MAYRSLYLTYRPQTFEEVAGQKTIVMTLENALASGKIAHAYLFAGPRGTGKTTMARLFAKALDCEEGVGKQCCKCSNCVSIAEGSHPDVIEIDAASNNGVDQVRDLIDKVKYAPIKGRYKVYIIDEVHMMSTGAFNALLKTLEEPPENVIFILCTTEPYKVIPTIISRCQRFDFSKIGDKDMEKKLIEVLKDEKASYDESGIKAVIELADGGMRDALSILDQVLSYSGNKLSEKDVLALYGLASMEEKISLLESMAKGDYKDVVNKSESYIEGGIDIRRLTGELINILTEELIYERTDDPSLLKSLDIKEADSLKGVFSVRPLQEAIKSLVATQSDFRNVNDIRSLFEISLLNIVSSFAKFEMPVTKPTPIQEAAPIKKEEPVAMPIEPKPEEKKPIEVVPKEPTKPVEKPVESHQKDTEPASMKTLLSEEKKEEAAAKEAPAPEVKSPADMFSTPPDFLFEDDKKDEKAESPVAPVKPAPPAPVEEKKPEAAAPIIDKAKILKPNIAIEGEMNELSDDTLIAIMVKASKSERSKLISKWKPAFEQIKGDPKLGNIATLLGQGHPYCLSSEALVLCYDFTKLRNKANIKDNQEALEEMAEQLLGRKVFIYAIDPLERSRVTSSYFNLMQIGQLPDKDKTVLNLPIDK